MATELKRKSFRVVLEIDLADLSKPARKEAAEGSGMSVRDLPTVKDILSNDIGSHIVDYLDGNPEEFFAGSEMYAFLCCVQLIEATEIKAEKPSK